ncbi:hypothetical protein BASA84_000316 [Batrachochytrium salamandrivorans]|nr:hypothetical protein BASA84_000316 [Batrachochytrium salamandrivorans]
MAKGQVKTRRDHVKSTTKPYIVASQPTQKAASEKKLKDMTVGEILHSIVVETDRLNAQFQKDLESFQNANDLLSEQEAIAYGSSKQCEAVYSKSQKIPADSACHKWESLTFNYQTAKSNLAKSSVKRDTYIKTVEKVRIAAETLLQAILLDPISPSLNVSPAYAQ